MFSFTCWTLIWSIFICSGITEGAKTCYTMIVSGAYHHPDVNGYYDVTDFKCHGRDVYEQRTTEATNSKMYIYFYRDSLVDIGWLVGTNPCMDERRYADLYVWNLNQRPDRGLLSWVEYDIYDMHWRYNRDFSVLCTEGLSYAAIVGIISGCLIGVTVIVGLSILGYQQCHKNERDGTTYPAESSNGNAYNLAPVTAHVIEVNNPSFQGDQHPGSYTYYDNHVTTPASVAYPTQGATVTTHLYM